MSVLYDPRDRGFPEAFTAVDRAQVAMLRELASSEARLVLKGGMAMRVVVGSMRLTKDVDLDRAADATNAIKASVRKALTFASQSARLLGATVDELKMTPTTVRMRLSGTTSAMPVKFVVEVSGRSAPPPSSWTRVTVTPPARYGIAPFQAAAYTHDMLAASKVAAIMSPNRNVPRDIYDLNDLIAAQPEALLSSLFEHTTLMQWRDESLSKASLITFDQAQAELLPYLPPDIRDSLNSATWEDMTLRVIEQVQRWVIAALDMAS
jgi:predicted nucleotidyltransferase component of viral defense system